MSTPIATSADDDLTAVIRRRLLGASPVSTRIAMSADGYLTAVTRRRLLGSFLVTMTVVASIDKWPKQVRDHDHEPEMDCKPLPNPFSSDFSADFGPGPGFQCATSSLPGAPTMRFQPDGVKIDPAS